MQELTCTKCGKPLKPEAKFCAECGTKIDPPASVIYTCAEKLTDPAPPWAVVPINSMRKSGGNFLLRLKHMVVAVFAVFCLIIVGSFINTYFTDKKIEDDIASKKELAAQGDSTAQFDLGQMYHKGEGVPQDDVKALEWYQKSAAQGNADAQWGVGWMLQNGAGVPKDDVKAAEWYQKSASQGDTQAQYELDHMNGKKKDTSNSSEASPYDPVAGFKAIGDPYGQGAAYQALKDNCSGANPGHACAEASRQLDSANRALEQHINLTQQQNHERDQQTIHDEQLRQQVRQQ